MTRTTHTQCKAGAAVRLFGSVPATVVRVYRDKPKRGKAHAPLMAQCRITIRTRDTSPHKFKPGEIVVVNAFNAIPRDCIHHAAPGQELTWDNFTIITNGSHA